MAVCTVVAPALSAYATLIVFVILDKARRDIDGRFFDPRPVPLVRAAHHGHEGRRTVLQARRGMAGPAVRRKPGPLRHVGPPGRQAHGRRDEAASGYERAAALGH